MANLAGDIVVVVFGLLGVLEWRAQVHQTNNGPVEVIKMKMRSLTHGKPPESASTEAAPSATPPDSSSKPEMQVEPPPQPQNQNPAREYADHCPGNDGSGKCLRTLGLQQHLPGVQLLSRLHPPANQPVAGQLNCQTVTKANAE